MRQSSLPQRKALWMVGPRAWLVFQVFWPCTHWWRPSSWLAFLNQHHKAWPAANLSLLQVHDSLWGRDMNIVLYAVTLLTMSHEFRLREIAKKMYESLKLCYIYPTAWRPVNKTMIPHPFTNTTSMPPLEFHCRLPRTPIWDWSKHIHRHVAPLLQAGSTKLDYICLKMMSRFWARRHAWSRIGSEV